MSLLLLLSNTRTNSPFVLSVLRTFQVDVADKVLAVKDSNAKLDYSLNWTDYFVDISDSIASFTILAEDVTVDSFYFNGVVTTAWISGGIAGDKVQVTFRIVTTNGRTDDRSIYLKIKEQ